MDSPGSPGTPAVSATRRDVTRIGRLHWLAGRRSATDPNANWDAFEAPDGAPLVASGDWRVVKHRLLDLVSELVAGVRDESLPSLGLDRIWIRADGRPVLIDFAAPGSTRSRTSGRISRQRGCCRRLPWKKRPRCGRPNHAVADLGASPRGRMGGDAARVARGGGRCGQFGRRGGRACDTRPASDPDRARVAPALLVVGFTSSS